MSAEVSPAAPSAAAPPRALEVLGIAGSLRGASYNRRLLAAARDHAPAGVRVTLWNDLAAVPPLDEDLEGFDGQGPDGVRRLREAVAACDGVLIATPEYNQSIPGVLKNAIDCLSLERPEAVLVGKPVAIMGATTGDWGTRLAQRTLRQVLFSTESLVLTGPAIYVKRAASLFAEDGALTDPKMPARLERFLEAFAAWIRRLHPELASGGAGLPRPRADAGHATG